MIHAFIEGLSGGIILSALFLAGLLAYAVKADHDRTRREWEGIDQVIGGQEE